MRGPSTVPVVYFALLFASSYANQTSPTTSNNNHTLTTQKVSSQTSVNNTLISEGPNQSDKIPQTSKKQTSELHKTTATADPNMKDQYIVILPTGDRLQLLVVALIVACFALLLTTLICSCQVCHLRGIISSLQPRHDNIYLRSVKEKSEPTHRDEGQVDGQPTETCIMLSEITTGQENEENISEIKTEEKKEPEPPVIDPNGAAAQVKSPEPDGTATESIYTEVND